MTDNSTPLTSGPFTAVQPSEAPAAGGPTQYAQQPSQPVYQAPTAQEAQVAEAQQKELPAIEFTHDGKKYSIEQDALDNLELYEDIEDEKYLKACRGFLGQAQWDAFKDSHRNTEGRISMSSAESFLSALMEAVGSGN